MEIAKYLNYCKNTKKDYTKQSSVNEYYEWAGLLKVPYTDDLIKKKLDKEIRNAIYEKTKEMAFEYVDEDGKTKE